ncbi:MAG: 50S ribosomal protein L6 [Candidatus Shikimatogenerans bostrichidophilus]|nr:MAG: 50S ribosomal protein L6 [Candidatus Shikimatogenerans bostrichidophilus]
MSRIGNKYIKIPNDINVIVKKKKVYIKGKLGILKQTINKNININIIKNKIFVINKKKKNKKYKGLHGLYRMLIYNMIIGVSKGFNKKLELVGIGYKAKSYKNFLYLNVGYSHKIIFEFYKNIIIKVKNIKGSNTIINIYCIDKQLLGLIASTIRSIKKPEPYKGKGIKYINEKIIIKTGKTV